MLVNLTEEKILLLRCAEITSACLQILQNEKLVGKIQELAKKKGCKAGQLALAWVHHQGPDVFPIPGTKNIKYLEENIAAAQIQLSKQELTELEQAIPQDQVSCMLAACLILQ